MAPRKKSTNIEAKPSVSVEDGATSSAFDSTLLALQKKYGVEGVNSLTGGSREHYDVISTGSLGLDVSLGIGGLPLGRIVEVYGAESSGKTTLALHALANAQARKLLCGFVDAEHALDPTYAEALGVNRSQLIFSQPQSGEEALNIVRDMVENGVKVIVVDSVAALVPLSEQEGDIGDVQPGAQARLMSQALRMLVGAVKKANALVIFINQTREKIGVKFGSPKTTAGGAALRFYASIRIEVARTGTIGRAKEEVGGGTANRTRTTVKKNKCSPPFKVAEFDIVFGVGISKHAELVDFALKTKMFTRSGAWYKYEDATIGAGREAAIRYLVSTPDVCAKVEEAFRAAGAESSGDAEE